MGAYYFMHPGCQEAMMNLLRHVRHGIEVDRLTEEITINGEAFEIESITTAAEIYEGHHLNTVTGT